MSLFESHGFMVAAPDAREIADELNQTGNDDFARVEDPNILLDKEHVRAAAIDALGHSTCQWCVDVVQVLELGQDTDHQSSVRAA